MPSYLEPWYAALSTPIGVVLHTNDPERLKQRLYQARAGAGDEDLGKISIVTSPTNVNELWLIKKNGSGS